MKRAATFQEILEEKMKGQTLQSSREISDTDPRNLAFLLGQVPVFRFHRPSHPGFHKTSSQGEGRDFAHDSTQTSKTKVNPSEGKSSNESAHRQTPPPPSRPRRAPHLLDSDQAKSLAWFLEKGEVLEGDFTSEELKTAFRRLALRLHPDVPGGSSEAFLELRKHHQCLQKVFRRDKRPQSQAA